MRIAIVLLLLVHGLIHLMGFLKPWRLAAIPQLSGRAIVPLSDAAFRVVGLLWLSVALGLVAAAVLRALDRDAWWMLAAPAIVMSQALIVLQWGDAKAGTLANVLLAVAVVIAAGIHQFRAANIQHARALLSSASITPPAVLRSEEVVHLPPPIRRWLQASGAIGQPRATTARLLQRGGMRTAPDQAFMHAEAQQYFTIDKPGFVWTVDVTMKGMPVVGRDTYVDGHGRMYITIAGLIPVADGTGPRFDQGTALRFLGEIIWFPSAALASYIRWDAIDDTHAKATLTFAEVSVSAVFEIDSRGRFVSLTAQRYLDGKTLETWMIPVTEWKTIRGIEMPTRGGAVWKLRSGDFDYYQWEILDVEPNARSLWGDR